MEPPSEELDQSPVKSEIIEEPSEIKLYDKEVQAVQLNIP